MHSAISLQMRVSITRLDARPGSSEPGDKKRQKLTAAQPIRYIVPVGIPSIIRTSIGNTVLQSLAYVLNSSLPYSYSKRVLSHHLPERDDHLLKRDDEPAGGGVGCERLWEVFGALEEMWRKWWQVGVPSFVYDCANLVAPLLMRWSDER